MDLSPVNSRIQSFIELRNTVSGAGATATLNIVVPAGTIFRGHVSATQQGDKASTAAVSCLLSISKGGNFICYKGVTAYGIGNFAVSADAVLELQAGTYAVTTNANGLDSGQAAVLSAVGVCYKLT